MRVLHDLDLAHMQDLETPCVVRSDGLDEVSLAGDVTIGATPATIQPEQLPAALDAAARMIWANLVRE